MLLDPIKKSESAVFQQILTKFLSPSANARALSSLLTTLAPAAAVFPDIRSEVVQLFVSQEFNAAAEGMGARGNGQLEALSARSSSKTKFLDGVDFASLDAQVKQVVRDLLQVMAYPALCSVCEYDASSLQATMETREAQLAERLEALQEELVSGNAEQDALATELTERLAGLRKREAELELELARVRLEARECEETLNVHSLGVVDATQTQRSIAEDEQTRHALVQARDSLHNYLATIYGPRRLRLVARRDKLRDVVQQKANGVLELLNVIKMGMEICCEVSEPGNEATATFMELHQELSRSLSIYHQVQSVIAEVAPDVADVITSTLEDIHDFKARFASVSGKK